MAEKRQNRRKRGEVWRSKLRADELKEEVDKAMR